MEYMSVKEAAKKWDISERYVQRYCVSNRIEGAKKFGGVWTIPITAEKPKDLRKVAKGRNAADEQAKQIAAKYVPMPLMNTAYPLGSCIEYIKSIENPDLKTISKAEYYYFSGQLEKASALAEQYLESEDFSLRLSACWIYAFANLALDQTENTRTIMEHTQQLLQVSETLSPEYRAWTVFIYTAVITLLHLPISQELPSVQQCVHILPPGIRMFALYIQAHYAYLQGQYGASIGVAETALVLEDKIFPIPTIYLHIVCAMSYMNMNYSDKAKEHLEAAWDLAKQDDMIQAFAEHHGLLSGLLEITLRKTEPESFRRIINMTYKFAAGWRKIHNSMTGECVADNLTTMEFTVAMLAAKGWSNKEIGAHLGVSSHTIKQHISVTLQKLDISQRKELSKYMLR